MSGSRSAASGNRPGKERVCSDTGPETVCLRTVPPLKGLGKFSDLPRAYARG